MVQIPIYSPCDGIALLEDTAGTESTTSSKPLNIREGMYVKMGQTVCTIQPIDRTWAILNIFDEDLATIRRGDPVSLSADANPDQMIQGRVDFIPPYRPVEGSTTRIRIYLDQLPPTWKIGTLIHGHIIVKSSRQGWYVPLCSVNRLGMRSIIWIQDTQHKSVFHAREVKTAIRAGDSIEIIAGFHQGDRIAKDASYMLDNESIYE